MAIEPTQFELNNGAKGMRDLGDLSKIWVSPTGSDNGDGTAGRPFRTIQKAIDSATPGVAIMVKEGVYKENLHVGGAANQWRLKNATAEKPIVLVSADGSGKAVIDAPGANMSAILVSVGHTHIYDFDVRGGASNAGDNSVIKVVTSDNVAAARGGIVIDGNTITGTGRDLVKAHMVHDIQITHNRLIGDAYEDMIDFVTVWDAVIADNTIDGAASRAINVKAGSRDIDIVNNLIVLESGFKWPDRAIVEIGGDGFSRAGRPPLPPDFQGFEAKNVRFANNVVSGDSASTVSLRGAVDSIVENNLLWGRGPVAVSSERSSSLERYASRDNTVRDNVYRDDMTLVEIDRGQGEGFVSYGNRTGDRRDILFGVGENGVRVSELTRLDPPEDAPATHQIVVRAGGVGGALAPTFELVVDGVAIGARSIVNPVNGAFADAPNPYRNYTFTYDGPTPRDVDIRFLNHGWDRDASLTRLLYIDRIAIDGVRFEAEHYGQVFRTDQPGVTYMQREAIFHPGGMEFDHLHLSPRWPAYDEGGLAEPGVAQRIDVRVAGVGGAIKPAYELWADGALVGRGVVDGAGATTLSALTNGDYETDSFSFVGPTPHQVSIVYVNDGTDAVTGVNRNMTVDHIVVNGERRDAAADAMLRHVAADGSMTTLTGAENMTRNGAMVFDMFDKTPPHTVVVYAAGTGVGVAPCFVVRVDGVLSHAASIQNPLPAPADPHELRGFRPYAFTHTGEAPRTLEIAFTNDGGVKAEARDLFIDYVEVNGKVYQTETSARAIHVANGEVTSTAGTEVLLRNGVMAFDLLL